MMNIHRFPARQSWPEILKRPVAETAAIEEKVRPVMQEVKKEGDAAVKKFTLLFDKADISDFAVSENEIQMAMRQIDPALFDAIKLAADNIAAFHKKQLQPAEKIETMPGVICWRKSVGIEKVGLYIPGGTAPLFSTVLMLAIPAVIAGCKDIVICTPPSSEGRIHPAILVAASYIGVRRIFKVGGVQAIAALTYGTETIPRVSKIFGPGNQFVTAAKQYAQREGVSIDMPAGPSEVAVLADATADPSFVAADLLSQAEHGSDSQVVLVTEDEQLVEAVLKEIDDQMARLPRKELAAAALGNSRIIVVHDKHEAMDLLNAYAPEHLILNCEKAEDLAGMVVNAGSVFIGHYSPESAGDYASGTNHTLPTNGYAHAYSGVSVDSFVKKITFQQLTAEGLNNIGAAVEIMAEAEGLRAHAEAVGIRLRKLKQSQ